MNLKTWKVLSSVAVMEFCNFYTLVFIFAIFIIWNDIPVLWALNDQKLTLPLTGKLEMQMRSEITKNEIF